MDGGEIPLERMDGEQLPHSRVQEFDPCFDAAGQTDRLVLSNADLRLLADFFLLLHHWDRMSTMVTEQPTVPEQATA
jgi:hypothetical protein